MARNLLKAADLSDRVRVVVERRSKIADTLAECNRRLAEADAAAARILEAAQRKAEAMVAEAQANAAAIGARAEREAEALRRRGEAEGYAAGEARARQELAEAIGDLLHRLAKMIAEGQECMQETIWMQESAIVELAVEMAERIVCAHIDREADVVRAVAARALAQASEREHVAVHVNPEDYESLAAYVPEFRERFPDVSAITIEPDPRVDRGGCMLCTRLGAVDARLARQLARLRETMRQG